MRDLPSSFFIPVPVNQIESVPFWINQEFEKELLETEHLLSQMATSSISPAEKFKNLGIQTGLFSAPFATPQEWNRFQEEVIMLKTERFFNPYSEHTGAGRNAILGPSQYKGIGRNHAATRIDWLHSWGGMSATEAMVEIFLERLIHNINPESSVPLFGGFLYPDNAQAFIIRSSDFLRCELIQPQLRQEDKDKICKKYCAEDELHRKFIDRFIRLMQAGIYHKSPTAENITIDGRIMDHYSLEWSKGHPRFGSFHAEYFFAEPLNEKMNEDELLQTLKSRPLRFCQTNFDFLLRQCLIIKEAYEVLNLPTLNLEEIQAVIRESFPLWAEFIIPPDDRTQAYQNICKNLSHKDYQLSQTEYGSICLDIGTRQRPALISTTSHLLNFILNVKKAVDPEDMYQILYQLSQHFNQPHLFTSP